MGRKKTEFIARFIDGKISENIKCFIHRIETLIDKGWSTPRDADANARTACENQRIRKYKDYFIRGLTPLEFEQKAHQALIEESNKTRDALWTLIINKDTSPIISAENSEFRQSSSNSVTTDSRFMKIEKTLNEVSNMVKNHQIVSIYYPNNPTGVHIVLHILQKIWP